MGKQIVVETANEYFILHPAVLYVFKCSLRYYVVFLFPDIFNGPQFVEIQKFCYYGKVTKRLLFIKKVA